MGNKFGLDLFGRKRIAALESQLRETKILLDDKKESTSWVSTGKGDSSRLPSIRVNDSQFIEHVSKQCGHPAEQVKEIMDCIEKEIPKLIAFGKRAVAWYGLGTFYAIFRRGAWRPRVRFGEPVKDAVKVK